MDREGLAYVQDLFLLMVAAVAVSMLMVNMATLYAARQDNAHQSDMDAEARRLCDALQSLSDLLHEGERGILDQTYLDVSNETSLRSSLRIDGGFALTIVSAARESSETEVRWAWFSGVPPNDTGACVSSIAVWFCEGDVRLARATFLIWRD